jgi:hypothetical protein
MRREHVEGALAATIIVTALFTVGLMNTGSDLTGPLTDATLTCSYDSDANELTVTVQSGQFKNKRTTGIWITNDGEPSVISNNGKISESGIWVHDVGIDDVADYPIETGDSVTVYNVTATTRTAVFWIRQGDNSHHPSLDTNSDPAKNCSS